MNSRYPFRYVCFRGGSFSHITHLLSMRIVIVTCKIIWAKCQVVRIGLVERRLAEREGFEPPIPFRVCALSRRVPSATRPSLRVRRGNFILAGRYGGHCFRSEADGASSCSSRFATSLTRRITVASHRLCVNLLGRRLSSCPRTVCISLGFISESKEEARRHRTERRLSLGC